MTGPRYRVADGVTVCEDCGVVVAITEAHTRFHSILSGHAWSLAVLKTSHVASHVHARYDVVERIDSKRFDSWSGDALAEVIAGHEQEKVSGEDPHQEYQDALSAHDRALSECERTQRMVDRARDAYRQHLGEVPVTGDT